MKNSTKKLYIPWLFISLLTFFLYSPVWANAEATGDIVSFQILTINDFHGALLENSKNPGAARIAHYLSDAKANNPQGTVIVSAGDMFQGTPDSNLLYGKTVVDIMNAIGFDAMTLGNHEFDWGLTTLKQRIAQSNFPYLAANIFDKTTGKNINFAKPFIILERQKVKIALIGLTTPQTAYMTNMNVVSRLNFTDPVKTVKKLLPQLKDNGAQLIIVVGHFGSYQDKDTGEISGEAADLAKNVSGLDAIVSGHTHQRVNGYVNGIPIVQAGYSGQAIGKINLTFNRKTGEVTQSAVQVIPLPKSLTPDPTVQDIITTSQSEIVPIKNTIIGKTINTLEHNREKQAVSLLGQWVTDRMKESVHADIAFQNAGGLRTSISAGNITVGNLYEVIPFDNTIVTVEMTGAQVLKVLQHGIMNQRIGMVQFAGINVRYAATAPENKRIAVTMPDGSAFDVNKTYKVATNDFMFSGGDAYTMFKEGKNAKDTNIPLRNLLISSIKKMQTIAVHDDHRFLLVPPSSTLNMSPAA